MNEETIEVQRQSFQVELKHMKGKVHQLDLKVKSLKVPIHAIWRNLHSIF